MISNEFSWILFELIVSPCYFGILQQDFSSRSECERKKERKREREKEKSREKGKRDKVRYWGMGRSGLGKVYPYSSV